jgi:hypothetical protein
MFLKARVKPEKGLRRPRAKELLVPLNLVCSPTLAFGMDFWAI